MAFTTTNLLSAIERRSFAPASQTTFETEDILAIASEEIRDFILPAIIGVREEFLVYPYEVTVTSGTDRYRLPKRAFGETVREVKIRRNNTIIDIPRVNPDDVPDTSSGSPDRFYMRNNDVVLWPNPNNSTDVLLIYYYITPGELIALASGAVISSIDTANNIVTVSSIPSTWSTGDIFDLIKANGGQEYLESGITLTSSLISGSNITLPSLPSDLAVGDYISIEETSPLLQIPSSFRGVVAQSAAAAILEYMNQPKSAEARAKAQAMLATQTENLLPRVEGEAEYIMQDWF